MINSFPSSYDDELLYSVVARYHLRSGNRSFKETILDLFDSDSLLPVVDFPGNLCTLSKNINNYYTPTDMLENNSLWPYYKPFLAKEKAQIIEQKMMDSKVGDIQVIAGVIASGIPFPRHLKYCATCYKDDTNKYGEPYWHRSHQLPGIYVCHLHGENLIESKIFYKIQEKRQKLYALSEIEIQKSELESGHHELYLYLAKQTHILLRNNLAPFGLEFYRDFYKSLLFEKALISVNGRVRMGDFIQMFSCFYGDRLLNKFNSNIKHNDNWLHKVMRKPRVSCHPLRHLLLLFFLGKGVTSYQEKDYILDYDQPPFPCLNKTADHYLQEVVTVYNISKCNKTEELKGIFKCECGFVYSRNDFNTNNDRFKRNRIIKFGEIWEKQVLRLYKNGLSYWKIANKLDVDYKTIRNQINKLVNSESNLDNRNDKYNKVRDTYRKNWIKNRKNNKEYSRTELRREKPGTYIWLYRNDKEWLFNNSPMKRNNEGNNHWKRVDWEKRDKELSVLIESEAKNIKSIDFNPIRITKSIIGKRLGILSMLEKNLDKMPVSKSTLERWTESVEQFRIRRIKSNASKLRSMNIDIREWNLKRDSGLPDFMSEPVYFAIQNELNSD